MEDIQIICQVQRLLAIIVDNPELRISESTRATEVPGWDSLAHVNLILALEREYGIRFSVSEIGVLGDVGELVELIKRLHSSL